MYHELCDDDAEFLDDLIGETDPRLTGGERRDAVIAKMEAVWGSSHADRSIVGRILWWAAQRPILERINQIDREEKVAVVSAHKVGLIPKRYAVQPTNPKTGEARGYVQSVMVDLTWDRFLNKLRVLERKHAADGANIEVFRQIARLRDKHPATTTPREACVLEGIDPDVLLDFGT